MDIAKVAPVKISVPFSTISEPLDTLFSMGFKPKYTELKSMEPFQIKGAAEFPAGFYKINDETMMLITYDRFGAKSNVRYFRIPTNQNIMQYTGENTVDIARQELWRQLKVKKSDRKQGSKYFSKKFINQISKEYQEVVKQDFRDLLQPKQAENPAQQTGQPLNSPNNLQQTAEAPKGQQQQEPQSVQQTPSPQKLQESMGTKTLPNYTAGCRRRAPQGSKRSKARKDKKAAEVFDREI